MRKHLIYASRIVYGFLIMSVFYCTLYELIAQNSFGAWPYSFILLAVLLVCSIGEKKVERAIVYLLICAAVSVLIFWGTASIGLSMKDQIIFVCFCMLTSGSYFIARAYKKICWIENPRYWILILYLLMAMYASQVKSSFLIKLISFAAGATYFLITLHVNDRHMGALFADYAAMERLPIQRMRQNNSKMFWISSGVTAGAMVAAPYLKIEQMIGKLLKLLQSLLRWFFGLFGNVEEIQVVEKAVKQEAVEFGILPSETTENLFLKIIDQLLELLSWALVLSATVAILFFMLKRLLRLYQQFNERVEENGDLVESIRKSDKTEEKFGQRKESGNAIFYRLSPDARIRKHYKKRIKKDNKETIKTSWTPEELEKAVTLPEEQKERFHKYYEKARYAKESCTKEEQREMLRL